MKMRGRQRLRGRDGTDIKEKVLIYILSKSGYFFIQYFFFTPV